MLLSMQLVLSIVCVFFVFQKLDTSDLSYKNHREESMWFIVLIVLFLMLVNWSLEAWRWQMSIAEEKWGFNKALRVVLQGQALNWVLPFTAGDATVRLTAIKEKGIGAMALALNRVTILLITLFYGMVGIASYLGFKTSFWLVGLLAVTLVGGLSGVVLREQIFGVSLSGFHSKIVVKLSLITILRYAVFTAQFFLLITCFNPSLSHAIVLLGIGWIFIFRSLIPAFWGSLGVREASAVLFFQSHVLDLETVVFPCTLIWVINVVLPSLIGSLSFLFFSRKLAT